jgi:hypothetical protein
VAQVEVVADAMQPGRQQADAAPVVEPAMDEGQLGCIGLDKHGGERSAKAAGGGFHGGRFSRRRLAHHHRAGRGAFSKSL